MFAEVLRRRLLVTGVAFTAAAAIGLPVFRPVAAGPGSVAIGLAVGVALFVVLAGMPRVPGDFRGACLRVTYLAAGAGLEELLWRGLALAALAPALGTVAALAVTSAAFALSHARLLGRRCAVHLLTGAGFGAAFLVAGLPAAVAAHTGYNVLVDLAVRAERERVDA
jgi:membrane protease YdiL (CAAX protease family)